MRTIGEQSAQWLRALPGALLAIQWVRLPEAMKAALLDELEMLGSARSAAAK